ncbi:MAG: SDR family NAD(P)-dependent oxidoreductase [Ignavibacteria bacterium]|nr:SDR family NAD(P)-dependent oxidoreductase [Ignavibacteria bacterium]
MLTAKNIVIVGATSAIAQGIAALYAEVGSRFLLVARNQTKTVDIASRLKEFGAEHVAVFITDLRIREDHNAIVEAALKDLKTIDVLVIAHGIYPNMKDAERDVDIMLDIVMTNIVSTFSIVHRFANVMRNAGRGTIAMISSVAGERGRSSNYIYGSTKSALTAYASGLRASLAGSGVHVLTVLPGPVDTPMTADHHAPFTSSVDQVSRSITNAIERRKKVLYTPWYWRCIMLVIKMLPESVFMKIKR